MSAFMFTSIPNSAITMSIQFTKPRPTFLRPTRLVNLGEHYGQPLFGSILSGHREPSLLGVMRADVSSVASASF